MLKFTHVLAFVVVIISAFLFLLSASSSFADAARTPKWNKLTPSYSYSQYLADSGKKVPTDPLEYAKREKLFVATLREVMEHNAKPNQLYKKGINQFADWTKEEFKRINGAKVMELDSVKLELQKKPYHSFHTKSARSSPYPNAFDWRNTPNVISTVKDQGQCGSCWAHGSTETLESHYAIATGELFVLSQQEVTACAPNPNQCGGTGGCGGSIAQLAFQYIVENGGITQEWELPYTAYWGTTGTCNKGMSASIAKFSGFKTVASNDQNAVLDALISAGPLAVNVDASNWNTYESGIYDGCNYANNISIDHVVQLVGWGVDPALDNTKYWTIRNSWNAGFGEQGYIRLIKHDTPQCGWNVQAQDGTACKGQPSTQWTCGQCGVLFDTSYPIPAPLN